MSVSAAKLAANRANAKRSTGPITPEGKARVSKNALRHGFTAREIIIRDDEQEEFDELQAEFHQEVQPQGAIENALFEQLLHAAWNLRRVRRFEAELFDGSSDPLADDTLEAKMNRLARHQARFERTLHRSLQELKAMKTNRAVHDNWTESTGQKLPVLIDIGKTAKQSQKFIADELYAEFFRLNETREHAIAGRVYLDRAREDAAEVENAA